MLSEAAVFNNLTIGYAGTFQHGKQAKVANLIEAHGGIPTNKNDKMDYLVIGKVSMSTSHKVYQAKKKQKIPIVTEQWLLDSTKGPAFELQDATSSKYAYNIDKNKVWF